MKKRFGPYQLAGGHHTEDYPVAEVKIVRVDQTGVETDEGVVLQIGREGAELIKDGKRFKAYIGERRVVLGEIVSVVGSKKVAEITLAEERTFGNPEIDVAHRRPGVLYEPFMSSRPLVNDMRDPEAPGENQGRNSVKYEYAVTQADRDENQRLRDKIAELESKLAAANKAQFSGQGQGKGQPGKPQAANA